MAAGPIVKDKKIPAIALSATNPLVTKGNEYYFRVCFIDPFQGTVMANYAFKELKAKKAVIIREVSNDYSVGLAKFFADSFKKLTGDEGAILAELNYNTGDQDFTAQLTTAQVDQPRRDLRPGQLHGERAHHQAGARAGHDRPVPGRRHLGDARSSSTWASRRSRARCSRPSSPPRCPSPTPARSFLDAYRKQYNKEPAAVTALGFDGYLVVRAALEKAGHARRRQAARRPGRHRGLPRRRRPHHLRPEPRRHQERGHQGGEGREVHVPDHGAAVAGKSAWAAARRPSARGPGPSPRSRTKSSRHDVPP